MTILDRIVTDVQYALTNRKRLVSVSELENSALTQKSTIDFESSLKTTEISIIAEIKQRSPSKGLLRYQFEPSTIAKSYSLNGASAISVLTETDHFGGSLAHLNTVANHTNLPVLRKDFIVDPYQVYEAKAYGADAILLIATILDKIQLAELHALAKDLNLSSLVEVYDVDELDKLDFDQIKILGVNNRNLHTFEVDINHSLNIFRLVDQEIIQVSESGLKYPKDLVYMYDHGVDAVLIGESFMRVEDPGVALKELRLETDTIINSNKNFEY
ncbi:MAG: indole-3-glycerol phosphate synthase TrpC [Bacteroidetes bacterium]|nr:indole-3-glycerol phosphate synthase TrpC [Bacteroidota bacterium]MCY4234314.1 indole-3-glycerol phosphate synthase TrpC [Bacteroidota bacterium]